ncbi:MAG TPA: DUF3574 domain-containing protein [bacterium]|jgi:hypothetical protein|nr:DUF3574 domain-containing protein [bacterium]
MIQTTSTVRPSVDKIRKNRISVKFQEIRIPAIAILDMLYLGQSTPAGVVTEGEMNYFLESVVTPRFPQGFSVQSSVSGQWRCKDGHIERESTKILILAHPNTLKAEKAVLEIKQAYMTLFSQESVMRTKVLGTIEF